MISINTIKFSIRSLLKNKLYTGINLAGLSIGIAGVMLIYKIVSYELSYNKDFTNYDRIVRVIRKDINKESGITYTPGMPTKAMELFKKNVPQFVATTKIKEVWPNISVPDENGNILKKFSNDEPDEIGFFVEPSFFDVFDWPWIAGDKTIALRDVHSIVLTENTAIKCFGSVQNAMGKSLVLDNLNPYLKVTGVVKNAPGTTDLPGNLFISYPTYLAHPDIYFYSDDWGSTSSNDQFYALLQDKGQFDLVNKIVAGIGQEEYTKTSSSKESKIHQLQPLSDIHYNTEVGTSGTHVTSKQKIKMLAFVGLLILIMACFNFINMANAQAITRLKEVGIRKTLGISNGQLMGNFLLETSLLVFSSICIGSLIAYLLSPQLQHISSLPASISFLDKNLFLVMAGLLILVTILAGLYPAAVLSSFQPHKIFSARHATGIGSGVWIRKTLVVSQFVIAIGLILATIITMSQLNFIKNMNLGFNKDLIYSMAIPNDSIQRTKYTSFRNELSQLHGIEKVSLSSDLPSSGNTWSSNWRLRIGGEDEPFNISMKYCDYNYQEAFKLNLLEGTWFSSSDTSREAVLNKTALTKAGVTDFKSVIGTDMQLGGRIKLRIVGVVDDYHSHSAHEPLEALLMTPYDKFYFLTSVKLKPSNVSGTITSIENTFNKFFPEAVFSGRFFDKEIERFYKVDNQLSALCKGFALLAIFISCLGLFALASFAITRRLREIGIRKVLGATTTSLINLITSEFVLLTTVAFVIAAPLTYILMQKWLQNFVFKTTIGWWMFAVALVAVLSIAFVTVAVQAIKAAWMNPVKSIRTE